MFVSERAVSGHDQDRDNRLIGGFHAVTAALEHGQPVVGLWLAANRRDGRAAALREQAKHRGIPIRDVSASHLSEQLPGVRHQGFAAELEALVERRESELPGVLAAHARPWVLALDQVQDPHNLGACLRSAAAAGVAAVIAPRKRSAGLTAAVRKVAAGAAEQTPFVAVTNLVRALERLKQDGYWIVGLDGGVADSIYDADLPERIVLVAGGEARGLRERTVEHCDLRVSIPIEGAIDSLNVAVAVGVALFEARRQRSLGATATRSLS